MPGIYKELDSIKTRLENHYKDMQDIEFTIEKGKLFMLQCRVGKRNGVSAVRMAVDMYKESLSMPRPRLCALRRISSSSFCSR